MVINTSALIAVLAEEPELTVSIRALERPNIPLLSSTSWLETSIVIDCR